MPRMILYARVSSEKQAENTSLESQVNRMVDYCMNQGLLVQKVYKETGSAGGKYVRPEFQKALDEMGSEDCDGLIVVDIDRFFRSTEEGLRCYREKFEPGGRKLISLQQNIQTDSPEGWWMFVQFLAMGEYASRKDVRRMRTGYDAAKAKEPAKFMGGKLGYGQSVQDGIKVQGEDPVLDFIRDGMAQGWNVSTITSQLNFSDLVPKTGRKFYKSTVGQIVARLQNE
jgi:DNA invertase Pin-like site-specific DNA recombinase